ncbi:MAG: L-threonylcarbamoyladenylate synthase [Christensenellales bacterium]|jgi:L-threonylcarbamoyladenylate synthase
METVVIDLKKNYLDGISSAAALIRGSDIVAFPTETVYGLGANALDAAAVEKIFKAKGRPQDNPLIVHISDISSMHELVSSITPAAQKLADAYWPGPMTLVLKKSALIPDSVTAGLDTVGIRLPSRKEARDLIRAAGVPIAAPSANASGRPSPTRAGHVLNDLGGRIPLILDGGGCEVGLESTVIDVTGDVPVILRPGFITPRDVEMEAGAVKLAEKASANCPPPSPGMKYMHYAPDVKITVVTGDNAQQKIRRLYDEAVSNGVRAIIAGKGGREKEYGDRRFMAIGSGGDNAASRELYNSLLKLEGEADEAFIEGFSLSGLGLALMDRLCRAASHNIIDTGGDTD